MKWIWVRHGETDANLAGKYVGHADVPMSDSGRMQAGEAASLLAQQRIDRLYASDLTRTMETARIIGQCHGLAPMPVQALRELDFGEWDLHTYNEVIQNEQERLYRWYDDPFSLSPPAGETLCQLGDRFDAWLVAQLARHGENETIVCVTHGGPLRWFQAKWLHGDVASYWSMPGTPCGGFFATRFDRGEWVRL